MERRIVQLLSGKELQTAEDVTFLIQVMVQEYLTRYTRMELLKLLANTDNESYLKLFRQYNGLELLASYMCDTAPSDWEIKFQVCVKSAGCIVVLRRNSVYLWCILLNTG